MKKIINSLDSAKDVALEVRQDAFELVGVIADLNQEVLGCSPVSHKVLEMIAGLNKAVIRIAGDLSFVIRDVEVAQVRALETKPMVADREQRVGLAARMGEAVTAFHHSGTVDMTTRSATGQASTALEVLSERSGVKVATIETWLSGERHPRNKTLAKVNATLKAAGVKPVRR